MTSIMWPTRSRVSQPVQRVMTFQFFGSETRRVKLARSRRMTFMTVSLPSADIGLTGAMTAVLISSLPSRNQCPDHPKTLSVSRTPCRSGRYDDGRKVELQVFPPSLVLGRQLQRRAERLGRLVHRESRLVVGDLEQYATGLAEIDRAEILALDHGRDVAPGLDQNVTPVQLMRIVGGTPRHVMDRPHRLLAHRSLGRVEHIEHRCRATGPGFEARAIAVASDLAEAHGLGEKAGGGEVRLFAQCDRMEAADLVMGIDRTVRPGLPSLVRRVTHQLDLDAIEILEDERVDAETGYTLRLHTKTPKAARPEVHRRARDRK